MKKFFLFLAAMAIFTSATLPAFAWGWRKGNRNKPANAAHKGNFNIKHAKIYKPRKGMKKMPASHVSRRKAAHSSGH